MKTRINEVEEGDLTRNFRLIRFKKIFLIPRIDSKQVNKMMKIRTAKRRVYLRPSVSLTELLLLLPSVIQPPFVCLSPLQR
jgi:hypothetical protein